MYHACSSELGVTWIATLSGKPQATLSHQYFLDRLLAQLADGLVGSNIAPKGFVTTVLLLYCQPNPVQIIIQWIELKVLHTPLTLLDHIFLEISHELSGAP